MQVFSRNNIPSSGWGEYDKIAPTLMVRIDGPFQVETREGILRSDGGWLALDADGWPYPIEDSVQQRTYRKRE